MPCDLLRLAIASFVVVCASLSLTSPYRATVNDPFAKRASGIHRLCISGVIS